MPDGGAPEGGSGEGGVKEAGRNPGRNKIFDRPCGWEEGNTKLYFKEKTRSAREKGWFGEGLLLSFLPKAEKKKKKRTT